MRCAFPGSIESLEPRYSPARLIAGPLPPQFGADLSKLQTEPVPELAKPVIVTLPVAEFDFNLGAALQKTGAGNLVLTSSTLPGAIDLDEGITIVPESSFVSEAEMLGGTLSLGNHSSGSVRFTTNSASFVDAGSLTVPVNTGSVSTFSVVGVSGNTVLAPSFEGSPDSGGFVLIASGRLMSGALGSYVLTRHSGFAALLSSPASFPPLTEEVPATAELPPAATPDATSLPAPLPVLPVVLPQIVPGSSLIFVAPPAGE